MASDGLSAWSGEFVARGREAAFRAAHLDEWLRHARLAFILSAILNTLFLASDWRFAGTPHFWVAVPARLLVIAAALVCLLAVRRARTPGAVEAVLVMWMVVTGLGVGLLVTAHTDIALFVVLLLPSIYYLAVPVAFRWTVAGGVLASLGMLSAFLLPHPPSTALGLTLAVAMLNAALILVVSRSNRLRRLEWIAGTELASSRETIEKLFNAAPVPLLITRLADGALVRSNDAGFAFFGSTAAEIGKRGEGHLDSSARAHLLDHVARLGRISNYETRMRLADGSIRDVLLAASQIRLGDEDCLMTGMVDITTRKVLEAHLEQMATTDSLTGLANRARFFAVAETEIRRASRTGRRPALLMIDLDHFKNINDQHGHEAGDQALKAFAELAVGMVRERDTVARLGGEEFAILLPEASLAAASKLAERLRNATEAMRLDSTPLLRLTISIGVARVEAGETAPDAALSRADRALYTAKRSGRNRVSSADRKVDADDAPQN